MGADGCPRGMMNPCCSFWLFLSPGKFQIYITKANHPAFNRNYDRVTFPSLPLSETRFICLCSVKGRPQLGFLSAFGLLNSVAPTEWPGGIFRNRQVKKQGAIYGYHKSGFEMEVGD